MPFEWTLEIEVDSAMTRFFATGFYQPISDLCAKLVDPNLLPEQVSGYAMSVVPLLVFSFESSINRLYLLQERGENESEEDLLRRVGAMRGEPREKLFKKIPLDPELAKDLSKVYAMRNAVAHAHFFVEDERLVRDEVSGGTIRPGFQGPNRFKKLDPEDGLRYETQPVVDPFEFGRSDVAKSFSVLAACFDALAEAGFADVRLQVDRNVNFLGESLSFWSIGERVLAAAQQRADAERMADIATRTG